MSAAPAALERVVPLLRCPHCAGGMTASDSGVVCASGHTFDRARHGHLTILGGRGRRFPGDSTDQVAARERVLGSGLFDPVADRLVDAAVEALTGAQKSVVQQPVLLDAGAGTGFYLGRVLDALESGAPLGIGTEISVAAARRLGRAHALAAALVADTWDGVPLADGCVDLAQVAFAPRNAPEFARVIRSGGTLVVVVPAEGHLEPLRTAAGMLAPGADKSARLDEDLHRWFVVEGVRDVDVTGSVPATLASDTALMGPSGVHLDPRSLARELGTRDQPVRVHVEVRSYRRTAAL